MESWTLGADGRYRAPRRPKGGLCAQQALLADLTAGSGKAR